MTVRLCLSNIAGNRDMNNENKNHKNLIEKLFRDKVRDILDRKTHKDLNIYKKNS